MARVLTEASGGMTSAYLIKAIQDAGHVAVASDIDSDCAGRYLADDFLLMPKHDSKNLWEKTIHRIQKNNVDIVIPSLDETLSGWAQRKNELAGDSIDVIVSPSDTLEITQDKWQTYQFFRQIGIPTPATSLDQIYPLIKPRHGRGGSGVQFTSEPVDMEGLLSQEEVVGQEYTVDVFCDCGGVPIYIVPRKRSKVVEGKSVSGEVVQHEGIIRWIEKICDRITFHGPINIQCFDTGEGVQFIEINPRIGGGMALGFAATENWMDIAIQHFVHGNDVESKKVRYGMKMRRYYAEVFI